MDDLLEIGLASPPLPSAERLAREIERLEKVADRSAPAIVVDDMQTMRLLLAQALRQVGFKNLHRASDGEVALKLIKENGCLLAVVDWNMPRMDGLELLDAVRSDPELDDIVFIMVTAENLDQRVIRAAEEKQDAYLTKPISAQRLTSRLELILERRLTYARALALEAAEEPERAVEEFMLAVRNRPNFRWPYFGLGDMLYRLGRLDEAERCFNRVLEVDPEAHAALVALGRIRELRGDPGGAQQFYLAALTDSPLMFAAYDAMAGCFFRQGRTQEALDVLERAVTSLGADNASRQERLGRLRYAMGLYPEAAEAMDRAVALKPHQHATANNLLLARALLAQDRFAPASQALGRAATADEPEAARDRVEAMLLTAHAHLRAGEPDRAERAFQKLSDGKAWGGRPPCPPQQVEREIGLLYLAEGKDEQARAHLRAAVEMAPGDHENLAELSRLCVAQGRQDLAAEISHLAEERREAGVDHYSRSGLEHVARGRYPEALAEYAKGLQIDPRSGRLYYNMAKVYYRAGDRDESLRQVALAARHGLERGDWELVVEAARFLAAVGCVQQALGVLKQVQSRQPGLRVVRAALEELAAEAGKKKPAPGGSAGEPAVDL